MKKTIIIAALLFAVFSHADAATLKASTLRIGSTGENVKVVQQKLSELGYEVSVDGKFGRKTSEAVAKFQVSRNLKADGLCGEKTLSIILGSKKGDGTVSLIEKPNPTTPVFDPTLPIDNPNLDWLILCRDGKPHMRVMSPNGGEVYQAGQQVEVKWRSCNFGTSNVYVQIIGWNPDWFSAEGYPNRANTGSAVITIPNSVVVNGQSQIPLGGYNVPEGKKFSMEVGKQYAVSGPSIMDRSDNLFTINASQPKVQIGTSATNPPTSTVTASQTLITNNVRLLGFTVKAIDGNVTLSKVPVQVNSTGSGIPAIVSQLKLVDGSGNYLQTADSAGNYINSGTISTSTGCVIKDCGFFFANFGNITIPSGTTKEFSVIADIRPITTSTGDATRTLKVSLANNDIVNPSNLGVVDQNGNTITANNTYRIGSAVGNIITINTAQVDMCPNISGIQTTIPSGMTKDVSGNCIVVSSVSRPTSTWENLCADGQPHAQIISPNGNEWYRAGQQMEVKWKTCNHPAGATVQVGYTWSDSANGPGGYQNDTAINDGIETYDLGVNAYNGEWRLSGKYYKAFIGFSSTNRDYSDDFFTIWDGNIIKPSPRTNSVN